MKTIEEINNKIRNGKAVVITAAEAKRLSQEETPKAISKKIDVVTTATFGPMCSSGLFINTGHTSPRLKMQNVALDGVPAYSGIAAVDLFLGATQEHPSDPRYGGAHVIKKLVERKSIEIIAEGRPSDCYPANEIRGNFKLNEINQAYLYNPRNCYQNYNAAVNSSDRELRTYMGILKPSLGSINYAGTGELSPLLNDPGLRTFGLGTRLFVCGGIGYVAWEGTQYNKNQEKDPVTGVPIGPAATLAIIGDLKGMSPEFIIPVVIPGYGISISLGIGAAIPVLDEDMARNLSIRNNQIRTRIFDYAGNRVHSLIDYESLINNRVELNGKRVPARSMTNHRGAMKIMKILKEWVDAGKFELSTPVASLPFTDELKSFPSHT